MYVLEEITDFCLIKTYWRYFKHNELLRTLNVYKIPWKKHQAVDFLVTDEISASEILFWKYLRYIPEI